MPDEPVEKKHIVMAYVKIIHLQWPIDLFHNDVKHGFQDDTRNLIGSAIMKVLSKPIKFRLTSRFLCLTSL